jgi:hypothetical protein
VLNSKLALANVSLQQTLTMLVADNRRLHLERDEHVYQLHKLSRIVTVYQANATQNIDELKSQYDALSLHSPVTTAPQAPAHDEEAAAHEESFEFEREMTQNDEKSNSLSNDEKAREKREKKAKKRAKSKREVAHLQGSIEHVVTPRRRQTNYAEPNLNVKLRRGDQHTFTHESPHK